MLRGQYPANSGWNTKFQKGGAAMSEKLSNVLEGIETAVAIITIVVEAGKKIMALYKA